MPGASPLGQLAQLLATSSPFLATQGGLAKRQAPRRAKPPPVPPRRSASSGAAREARGVPTTHRSREAAAAVAQLAPAAVVEATDSWLSLLLADLRARHAALRKSRARLARAAGSLTDGRAASAAGADGAAVATLLRQLDGALAGEEAALVVRVEQLMATRARCGSSLAEGTAAGDPAPQEAAAASAALVLTAAALAAEPDTAARPASSGSQPA